MNQIIIERENLEHNIHMVKEKIKNLEHKPCIIAVIKGNGYGMDSLLLARKLLDFNIDFFAVSEIAEAKRLRENGFTNRILLLESTCIEREVEEIISLDLIATVGSLEALMLLNKKAEVAGKVVQAHLKIDTGFSRFGFLINNHVALQISEALASLRNIEITGTYSHFAESYANDKTKTEKQFEKFLEDVKLLNAHNVNTGMLHICNSSAFFKYPNMYLDAVRIGSAFTGRLQISEVTGLKRVGYLESEICEIRDLPKGSEVGYSGTYVLKEDAKVAIVEAGYEAGVGVSGPRDSVRLIDKARMLKSALSNFGKDGRMFVEINGKRCLVLGRVGMKNMMVDVSAIKAETGDKVKIPINLIFANSNIERQEL
ncbi:MAG: alanine racemase [Clostridia bacterium]|nr:alanine racemase [Clostridia bacterium]